MQPQSLRLSQKRVLITGAERGIGSALARRFASDGAQVVLNTFGSVDGCEELVEEINATANHEAIAIQGDVRNLRQMAEVFKAMTDKLGGIDILVNNAGVESVAPALSLSLDEWDRVVDTNLRGSFVCAQMAAKIMRLPAKGGVILNITSIHDSVPRLGTSHYCASKAGLTMLTKSLALEWAQFKIRVVGVAPGAIETEINRSMIDKIGRSNFETWIPAGRLGTTTDIADAAVFLVSDESSYVSGATLVVDGAYSLNTIQYDPR